ncbi:MAG TPA: cytochrome c peroxidase [Bacteroidia bacterium]|nr:cytochrome c peroxidase [Bacteroidia bacterium]
MSSLYVLCLTFITLCFAACKDNENESIDVTFKVPAGWPAPVYNNPANPITEAGFKLGRKLFYDPQLSRDNTVSCGSCHQQFAAFANLDHKVSHGIDNLLGTRNAPPMFNLAWHPTFMWDGGVNHIEVMPLAPIGNPVEMDEQIDNVIAKLRADNEYRFMFKEAFGTDSINSQKMLLAFAQFMSLMVSANSKYDKVMDGQAIFSSEEASGYSFFKKHCNGCHTEPLMTNFTYRNNGLDNTFADLGRGLITQQPNDMGLFKVPSLRNIALSKPYMHDGRFQTLEACIEHYNSGIKSSATVDSLVASGIAISTQEKTALISFLNTLTDSTFITDKRFIEQ